MKIKNILLPTIGFFMVLGTIMGIRSSIKEELEPDDTNYGEKLSVSFDAPEYISRKDAVYKDLSKIIIHFYDEDGNILDKSGNINRAFWIWTGSYAPEMELSVDEGYDKNNLTMTFDLSDPLFSPIANGDYLCFIIKNKSADPLQPDWTWQTSNTKLIFEDFPPKNNVIEVWTAIKQGRDLGVYESEEKSRMTGVKLAYFTGWKTISCINSAVNGVEYRLYAYDQNYLSNSAPSDYQSSRCLLYSGTATGKEFSFSLNYSIHPNMVYTIESNEVGKPDSCKYTNVTFERLFKTERFIKYFNYNGELGCFYTPSATTFRVWAPTSGLVRLWLYDSGTPSSFEDGDDTHRAYQMSYRPGGVWEITITNRDLAGYYYCYQVTNSSGRDVVMDPYAKGCGINGVRGLIYDPRDTDPVGWDTVPSKWDGVEGYDIATPQELSVYEIHIRDLTMDETWVSNKHNAPGTFNAFCEAGTTYSETFKGDEVTVKTGFDHIEEMGVNAIQILPVFDSDNSEDPDTYSFNWGYNPLNYNCVEGAYSSDPFNGYKRIMEYKSLVKAYSENANHTRVIMDVVYNHVNSASDSCFNILVPKYYFRFDETWSYFMDGSGCGNEVKSEAPMMRKYIIDSLKWWATEYKIKGFRFDLMGLIDTVTMKQAKEALYEIDPDIYLYGEGWAAGDYGGDPSTHGSFTDAVYAELYQSSTSSGWVGGFNDGGRDALRGDNTFDGNDFWGFITKGSESVGAKSVSVAGMLLGKHINKEGNYVKGANPKQTVNYASCHDNFTLYDQAHYTAGSYIDDTGARKYKDDHISLACLATASCETAIMMSNGIAFIQGGEELFRSKVITDYDYEHTQNAKKNAVTINGEHISHNSYNLSDETNSFKWDRKIHIGDVDTKVYWNAIMVSIHTRKDLTFYAYEDFEAWDASGIPSSDRPINTWNEGVGSTVVAMKNNDYFFFLAGCNNEDISFGALSNKFIDVFCSNVVPGGYQRKRGAIYLGWYTSLCLVYRP